MARSRRTTSIDLRVEAALVYRQASGTLVNRLIQRGDRVWAVGGSVRGLFAISTDRGRSFSEGERPDSALRGARLEGSTLWATGDNWTARIDVDADDARWSPIEIAAARYVTTYAIDRDHRGNWLVLGDGVILRSQATKAWRRLAVDESARFFDLCTTADATWVVNSHGAILRATTGGFRELGSRPIAHSSPLCAIVETPRQAMLAVGDGGVIVRSVDRGSTWTRIDSGLSADLERIAVTKLGIFVIGNGGALLVSYDDGQSFHRVACKLTGHLWSIVALDDGSLVIGGEQSKIWRIERSAVALAMRDAMAAAGDQRIAALAGRVADGDEGSDLVLEDALRERGWW